MRFGDDSAPSLAPVGRRVARVVGAVEKPIPWDRANDGLFLTLEVDERGEIFTLEHVTPLTNTARLAVICRACGVDPRGEVDPALLVDTFVAVTIVRRVASKSGLEYSAVSEFAPAPPPEVETRRAPPPDRREVRRSDAGSEEIPF